MSMYMTRIADDMQVFGDKKEADRLFEQSDHYFNLALKLMEKLGY